MKIGITERGDAALDQSWRSKLDSVAGVVLITKAPHLLGEIPDRSIIHCTITGYGGMKVEPNVAKPEVTLDAYHSMAKKFGSERIVLRVDPIIPTEIGLQRAMRIIEHTEGRVRISFLDAYPHVKERFERARMPLPGIYDDLDAPIEIRERMLSVIMGRAPWVEVCGEPGLPCTGCISQRDIDIMDLGCKLKASMCRQRAACACVAEKHELLTNRHPCPHGCLYCYWK